MTPPSNPAEHCAVCARELTPDEVAHYGDLCDACMRAADDRVKAWLAGCDDPLLDAIAFRGITE